MRASPKPLALLVVSLLALAGCRTLPGIPGSAPKRGFDLVLRGGSDVDAVALENAIAFELDEFESSAFARAQADDAAHQAQVHLRNRGFAFATVDYAIERKGARPKLVLAIVEGPRTTIDEAAFRATGVTVFTRGELLSLLEEKHGGLLGSGPPYFVAARVRAAADALRDEYIARGYLDVSVPPVGVAFSEDRTTATLSWDVTEGPAYHVGVVELVDSDALTEEQRRACETLFEEARRDGGRPRVVHPGFSFELAGSLKEMFLREGYTDPRVDVRATRRVQDGLVDLIVTVAPGPTAVVGEVERVGTGKSRDSFVRSRLRLGPGDPWTADAERQSLSRLYATGLYSRVRLALEPPAPDADPRNPVRDLSVELEELPSREYWIEPGYGSYEQFRLRLGARERNLYGTGRQLSLEGTWAVKAQRARLGLSDPWLFRTDLTGDLNLSLDRRENPSFTSRDIGLGAFVTNFWSREQATIAGYQFRNSKISDFADITAEVASALETVNISSVRLSHRYDTRSSAFLPAGGTYAEGGLEWGSSAFGSELDFLRATLAGATYFSLREGTILATTARLGVIRPIGGSSEIPVQERFFNGGENTVRSYKQDQLGPTDADGDPVGGEASKTWSIELRQRLGESPWELAAFYDIGDVQSRSSDWASTDGLGSAVGLGIRYLLPVGPLRVDLAWNPSPVDGEEEFVAHVALGIAF